jgi:hypothetical protein
MKAEKKTPEQVAALEQRNATLRDWLKDHDLLNLAKLCRRIPYNRATFQHFEDGTQNLGMDTLVKVEKLLEKYNYPQTLA